MSDNKKYNIIYADPPWRYEQRKIPGGAEQHYPTMTLDDICNLPVEQLADKNCALFLWTTFPKLKEAFQVIDAWGFQYRTLAFLWLKQNRKSRHMVLRYGLLDALKCRGLSACAQRTPKTSKRGDSSICYCSP